MRTTQFRFVWALFLSGAIAATAAAQTPSPSVRNSERVARAQWSPSRGGSKSVAAKRTDHDASFQQEQPVATTASLPSPVRQASATKPVASRSSGVQQAQHIETSPMHSGVIPSPTVSMPMEGEVYYEPMGSSVVGGACDAMGPACGCGSLACDGCDSIGTCGQNCGCSMCGELPSGRAWRPALTLSLPQDGWISYEGLSWWQDGVYVPALFTTSPTGTARADAGVLTRPGTSTLFGDRQYIDDGLEGSRLRFGIWLDRCHTLGVGAEFIDLGRNSHSFATTSAGSPIVARPFFNTATGLADSELVAFPGIVSGTGTARIDSQLSGGSFHFRHLRCCDQGCESWLFCGCPQHYCTRMDFRLGYRYLELDEGVRITEDLVSTDTANPGTFDITDNFRTLNQFNGVDLGWSYRLTRGYWTWESLVKLAIGNTKQSVTISGQTIINDPNDPPAQTFDAGFLALASNSGVFEQNQFSVVPELNLTLGYQLTDHLKATFGYSGIYWSNVVRPGQHIPTDINPNFLPPVGANPAGDPRPVFAFDTVDYWAHGINYGLEYRW
ncbi:BBP7 family outer membrane beta-barrel protein [Stieleria varia]|uniref:BBP7 family outer membrane beta-barrel protein n=1 Tax=Stieleria varia TaxID=2528005 RepID=UPI0018D26D7D|nr:BBP7 family outer membrane beta-barrel protein [Stieleria varia]